MNTTSVNCNAGFIYQARVSVPVAGGMGPPPTAGLLGGWRLRLCADKQALDVAIDAALDDLVPTESPLEIGLLEVPVSQALQQQFLLPLHRGTKYYGHWYKAGLAKNQVDEFVVSDRSDI